MKHIALLLMFSAAAAGQVTPTVVTDTIRVPIGGQLFRGVVRITPPNVVCGGASYKPVPVNVQVSAGVFSVSLVPNDLCSPAGTVYQVRFQEQGGGQWQETWRIPESATPITLHDVYIFTGGPGGGGGGPVSWTEILGKPSTFPPDAHHHNDLYPLLTGAYANPAWLTALAWSKLTGVPATFPPDAHTHPISGVSGLQTALDGKQPTITPGTSGQFYRGDKVFAPVPWGEVAGKPTTFPPAAHGHDANEIGSGTLPVARGGTGRNGNWTPGRCVQVNVDGTALEPAGAECGVGGGGGGGVAPGGMVKEFSTPATSWTFPASEHLYESCAFDVVTWLQDGDYLKIVHHSDATCQTASGEGQWDVVVTFADAQAGKMGLIPGGSPAGSPNLSIPLDAVTTIDIEHNFGTKAIVPAVYDGADRLVEGDTFETLTDSTARQTFAVPQSGRAVLNRAGWHGDVQSGGGGGGDTTSVQNSGSGAQVLKTGTNVTGRTLVAGTGIEITQGADTVTIANTGGGGGGGGITAGEGLLGDGSSGDPLRVNPATVPMFFTTSATLNDWGTIGAGACATKTISMPGAAANDTPMPGWPATIPVDLVKEMWVTGADVVTVKLCNYTGAGIAVSNGLSYAVRIVRSF